MLLLNILVKHDCEFYVKDLSHEYLDGSERNIIPINFNLCYKGKVKPSHVLRKFLFFGSYNYFVIILYRYFLSHSLNAIKDFLSLFSSIPSYCYYFDLLNDTATSTEND